MSLVTVAIASYNHSQYITQTIESILDQTFQNFEIIIVDDASSDNSVDLIKSYRDKRIKLIESKRNQGVCHTINKCLAEASGQYIATVGSDDILIKDKLEKQVNFLEKNKKYDAVFSGVEIINENNKINQKKTSKYSKLYEKENRNRLEWLNYFFFNANCLAAPTLLMKTQKLRDLNGFDPRIIQAHDFDLWVRLCLSGSEIYILHEKLLQYRETSKKNNLSNNSNITRSCLLFENEKILHNFINLESPDDIFKIFPDIIPKNQDVDELIIKQLLFLEAQKKKESIYHQQFSLNILYDLMQDLRLHPQNDILNINYNQYRNIISHNPLGIMNEKLKEKSLSKLAKILTSKKRYRENNSPTN